jgi:hypothetical protein
MTESQLNPRIVKHHIVANDSAPQIEIAVMDEPGAGGASHRYLLGYADTNQSIKFQEGPIKEAGVNGVTQEALLAVVIDRLQSFQAGPFPSRENALALTKCQEALMWLQTRTRDRIARGVEGVTKA